MSHTQTHEMEGTVHECLRALISALGHRDFEVTGDKVIVKDQDKRFVISLIYEGNRHLGSLDLPMTRVDYEFTGYTEAEAKEFQDNIAKHLLRAGGG